MSLLLRNELRLSIGPRRCEASIWRAGLPARHLGSAEGPGYGEESIEQLLDALQADGHALPAQATACIADEYLYYVVLPASGAWGGADQAARRYFADAIGSDDLLVETSLTPCGRQWIAVAVEPGRVALLRDSLAQRDIALRHVRPALLQDLDAMRADLRIEDAVLIVLRSEGASFVDLQAGSISCIVWERIDLADPELLMARVAGHQFRRQPASTAQAPAPEVAVIVVPGDDAQQERMRPLAAAKGWRLTAPLQAPSR